MVGFGPIFFFSGCPETESKCCHPGAGSVLLAESQGEKKRKKKHNKDVKDR